MNTIYENKVKKLGDYVNEFKDESLIILFGDNAPEEIADYCYCMEEKCAPNNVSRIFTAIQTRIEPRSHNLCSIRVDFV